MSEIELKPCPLNPDAYSFLLLQRHYREQMSLHASHRQRERELVEELERTRADAATAGERATSIMETLLKLEQPKDGEAASLRSLDKVK